MHTDLVRIFMKNFQDKSSGHIFEGLPIYLLNILIFFHCSIFVNNYVHSTIQRNTLNLEYIFYQGNNINSYT